MSFIKTTVSSEHPENADCSISILLLKRIVFNFLQSLKAQFLICNNSVPDWNSISDNNWQLSKAPVFISLIYGENVIFSIKLSLKKSWPTISTLGRVIFFSLCSLRFSLPPKSLRILIPQNLFLSFTSFFCNIDFPFSSMTTLGSKPT